MRRLLLALRRLTCRHVVRVDDIRVAGRDATTVTSGVEADCVDCGKRLTAWAGYALDARLDMTKRGA